MNSIKSFLDLGYYIRESTNDKLHFLKNENNMRMDFIFDLKLKTLTRKGTENRNMRCLPITIDELNAIQNLTIELGWTK